MWGEENFDNDGTRKMERGSFCLLVSSVIDGRPRNVIPGINVRYTVHTDKGLLHAMTSEFTQQQA